MTSSLPPLAQAISGSLGSVVSNTFVYPLDTLSTRLQTRATSKRSGRAPTTFIETIKKILREEGVGSFYLGLGTDSLSTGLSNFIYFYAYSLLRTLLINRKLRRHPPPPASKEKGSIAPPVLSAIEEILIGCLSGVISKGTVAPLSNITVRAQTASTAKAKQEEGEEKVIAKPDVEGEESDDDDDAGYGKAPSSISIAKDIYEEKGWTGFWSGFKSSIILTTNPAITFYLFDLFKRALIPAKHREHPTPAQTFFTSSLAASIAAAITYPLILSKTRLQYKSPSGRRLYYSNVDVFRKTIKKSGITGMYVGLEAQLIKSWFSEGVKMLVKDRLELLIVFLHRLTTRKSLE
ncbi:hypothetical protein MNV49_001591 [Pseudohyphozyma bogoriensis]|nr:hypothetical protein MNV49_001591 [Pseudohyphozyma bogoriensis]